MPPSARFQSRVALSPEAGSVPAEPAGDACTNCGGGPVGRFCAACGQRHIMPHDFTAPVFLRQALNELISVDGRFWPTLWTLLRHPGKLAREYFDGRGARYMRPLNLFLLLNLVFFVVQPHTGLLQWHLEGYLRMGPRAWDQVNEVRIERALARQGALVPGQKPRPLAIEPMPVFESEFESTIQNLKKSMLLAAIPLFALAIGASYGFRRHRLAEHLVFSTHFYAFTVFVLTVVVHLFFMVTVWILRAAHAPASAYRAISGEAPLVIFLFAVLATYLHLGLRRMYGDSRLAATLRAVALFAAYQFLVILFAVRMFQVTLWAM